MQNRTILFLMLAGLTAFAGEPDRLNLKPRLDLSSVPETPEGWQAVIRQTKVDAKKRAESSLKALPAAERPPARRLIELYVNMALPNSGITPIAATIEGRIRLREWVKAASAAAGTQANVIESGMSLLSSIAGSAAAIELRAAALEWLERAQQIKRREPKNARIQRLIANLIFYRHDENPLERIGAYLECVSLDPKDEFCQQNYIALVQDYEQLHCVSNRVKDSTQFVLANETKTGDYVREVKSDGITLFAKSEPDLRGGDFDTIFWGFSAETRDPLLEIRLTPAGAAKFERVTGDNVGKFMVMQADGQVIAAPKIMTKITGNRLSVSPGTAEGSPRKRLDDIKTWLTRMCSETESRKVPEKLRR